MTKEEQLIKAASKGNLQEVNCRKLKHIGLQD